MNKIEVRSNNIVIGYTYDEGKTIEFLDNGEAKRIIRMLTTGEPVGISSRKFGRINNEGEVSDVSDINELNIIQLEEMECQHDYSDGTGWHVCKHCGDMY